MTAAEEQRLVGIVKWRVREWERDIDYDDILAQAYHEACRSYVNAQAAGNCNPLAAASKGAQWGRALWLRAWYGDLRAKYQQQRLRDVALVDFLPPGMEIEESEFLPSYEIEPAILERLWFAETWQQFEQHCTKKQLEVLRRVILEGETMTECAEALGLTCQGVCNAYRRGVDRYLAAVQP